MPTWGHLIHGVTFLLQSFSLRTHLPYFITMIQLQSIENRHPYTTSIISLSGFFMSKTSIYRLKLIFWYD